MTADYHAQAAISHSMLQCLRRSPALYYGRYVTGEIPPVVTDAMAIGSLVHAVCLGTLDQEYQVIQGLGGYARPKATKEYKTQRRMIEEAGKIPIVEADLELGIAIREAIARHPIADRLIGGHGMPGFRFTESPLYWSIDEAALTEAFPIAGFYKAKPDVQYLGKQGAVIVDLKTAEDPTPRAFGRHAADYGYLTQAAWYTEAVCLLNDYTPENVRFRLVAAGKKPPHDIWCYEVTAEQIAYGRRVNARTLEHLDHCRQSEAWHAPRQIELLPLEVPHFCMREENDENA